jgi:biopolymer transport protein ExbD
MRWDPEEAADLEPADGLGDLVAEINITPLTDVFLVLLIIFMVSSTALVDASRQEQLNLALPTAHASAAATSEGPTLVVGMLADGKLMVDGQTIEATDQAALLVKAQQKNSHTSVVVDADGEIPHRQVVGIIDQVQAAGFPTVGIGARTAD